MRANNRAFVSILAVALLLGSCGGQDDSTESDQEQIQSALENYLPLLANAYANQDFSGLEGFAAQKEIARIHKRVEEFRGLGRTLVPTFRRLTIEQVKVWNYSNAIVTTLEVWDVYSTPPGSDTVLSEEIGKPSRVKYQLKRDGERWRVLFRSIQE